MVYIICIYILYTFVYIYIIHIYIYNTYIYIYLYIIYIYILNLCTCFQFEIRLSQTIWPQKTKTHPIRSCGTSAGCSDKLGRSCDSMVSRPQTTTKTSAWTVSETALNSMIDIVVVRDGFEKMISLKIISEDHLRGSSTFCFWLLGNAKNHTKKPHLI